ncbi:MAG TPA: hypothetical protein VJR27_01720 [Candidatus Saccharimonadales bacterium]|nr:hypothetical protein [Candidatus Saccharimonadales bacterium]
MSEQEFKRGNLRPYRKYAINILGRFVGAQLRNHHPTKLRSVKVVDAITRSLLSKPETSLSTDRQKSLDDLFQNTTLWHGTGRYQYKNGKSVDVLRYIVSHGALYPQPDSWDFAGPMTTISLAPARMYARAYADMHGKGSFESERYGSALFWAALFVGDMKVEGLIEGRAWTPKGIQAGRNHIKKNADTWYRKISSTKLSTMEAFHYGSDIPGNYPIIFGIKGDAIDQAPTTRTVAIHEVRAKNHLPLRQEVTYLEVPRDKIAETEGYLDSAGFHLPVIAIEDVEAYASGKLLSELVANQWSKRYIAEVNPKEILETLARND